MCVDGRADFLRISEVKKIALCFYFVLMFFFSSVEAVGVSIVIIRKLFLVLLKRLEMTTIFRVSRS